MEHEKKRSKSEIFFTIVKNLFFVLLILQFAPLMISGLKSTVEDALFPKAHVGYLSINGSITDAAFYIKKLDEFAKSSDIQALLLRVNSPGGYSGTCNAVFSELKKFREQKPVVAVIENVGASGAYYIAMASNVVIANPLSMVGSIGVFMELPNFKELLSSWKINYRYIQSGDYKTAGSAVKELTPGEVVYLQKLSDNQYDQFVKDVAQCRKLIEKDHKTWADGKIFTGFQALDLKLIDKLGTMSDGIDEIKKLLETDEEIKLIHAKKQQSLLRMLSGSEDDDFGSDSMSFAASVASFMHDVWTAFTLKQTSVQPQSF
jgi:protease IV